MNKPITITTVVEHAFCPKFTYYSEVLGLDQYEGKRGTVLSGRMIHSKHEKTNVSFIPKNIKGKKLIGLQLYSKKHNFTGKIDEAIETDNSVILVERKYSDYNVIGDTIKTQLGLLSILIEENFNKQVNQAVVIFQKKKRTEIIVGVDEKIKLLALNMLKNTENIIKFGLNPPARFDGRCLNCCFRKVCPVGSLNILQ